MADVAGRIDRDTFSYGEWGRVERVLRPLRLFIDALPWRIGGQFWDALAWYAATGEKLDIGPANLAPSDQETLRRGMNMSYALLKKAGMIRAGDQAS